MSTNRLNLSTIFFTAIAVIVFMTACSKSSKEKIVLDEIEATDSYKTSEQNSKPNNNANIDNSNLETSFVDNLKIIKSANIRFKVKNIKTASKQIAKITRKYNGYISDQKLENNNYKIESNLFIKVPQKHFESFLDSLDVIAEFVDHENISTDDVTEEYVDIEARLNTKLEVKKRYETILRNKATSIKEVLITEEKIGKIQEEIEAAQGRLKYLTNKTTYSTIQLEMYETANYKEEPKSFKRTFVSKTKQGFNFGWGLIENIFLGLIYIWPLLIIATISFIIIRKRKKA